MASAALVSAKAGSALLAPGLSLETFRSNIGGQLIDRMDGFSDADRQVLKTGLQYLQGPGAEKWLADRREDLQRVQETFERSAHIQAGLKAADQKIEQAAAALGENREERNAVDETESKENSQFQEESEKLRGQLGTVELQLRDESVIAPFSFRNPLASRAGRLLTSLGQYSVAVVTPLLGWAQKEALVQKCGAVLSATISATAECASTLFLPQFYYPIGIALGVSYLCYQATKTRSQRIQTMVENQQQLQDQLNAAKTGHDQKVQDFRTQKSQLDLAHQESEQVLNTSQETRRELTGKQDSINAMFAAVQARIQADTAKKALTIVRTAGSLDPTVGQTVGQPAIEIFFNAAIGAFTQEQQFAAIAAAAAAIESAPASELRYRGATTVVQA